MGVLVQVPSQKVGFSDLQALGTSDVSLLILEDKLFVSSVSTSQVLWLTPKTKKKLAFAILILPVCTQKLTTSPFC